MLDAGRTDLQRFDPHSLGLQFPLTVGKEWQGTSRRFDKGRDAGTFVGAYKVTGIETVTVPPGPFAPSGGGTDLRGPVANEAWRFAHWYAPEVRTEVKLAAIEPDLERDGDELVEYRPASQISPPLPIAKEVSEAFLGIWKACGKKCSCHVADRRADRGRHRHRRVSRGAYIFPGLQRPSQQRVEGKFLDAKTLRFEVWDDANQRWAEATYTLNNDGTLTGAWKSGGVSATGC